MFSQNYKIFIITQNNLECTFQEILLVKFITVFWQLLMAFLVPIWIPLKNSSWKKRKHTSRFQTPSHMYLLNVNVTMTVVLIHQQKRWKHLKKKSAFIYVPTVTYSINYMRFYPVSGFKTIRSKFQKCPRRSQEMAWDKEKRRKKKEHRIGYYPSSVYLTIY